MKDFNVKWEHNIILSVWIAMWNFNWKWSKANDLASSGKTCLNFWKKSFELISLWTKKFQLGKNIKNIPRLAIINLIQSKFNSFSKSFKSQRIKFMLQCVAPTWFVFWTWKCDSVFNSKECQVEDILDPRINIIKKDW